MKKRIKIIDSIDIKDGHVVKMRIYSQDDMPSDLSFLIKNDQPLDEFIEHLNRMIKEITL